MARNKFKLTGFARFFFVMLLLAPLAYIGASYANGEDGLENMKNLFKGKISTGEKTIDLTSSEDETTKVIEETTSTSTPETSSTTSSETQAELNSKDKKIQFLIDKNIKLEEQLEEKTEELKEVKKQLKAIKNALGNAESTE